MGMFGSASVALVILGCLVALVASDVYMQNPRGSNDRLNEAGQDRNNAQRLFDSENNARGGYCWGEPMQFYTGSELSIEWTSQHGCGSDNVECNIVLQYMCEDDKGDPRKVIRDGKTTNIIEDNPVKFNLTDETDGQYVYGMHESYDYYQECKARERNKGLFLADQTMEKDDARATRQNKKGQQHGFECPEERDYYPYWHPSPWKDIAVLVDDTDQCDYFRGESQNVKEKHFCSGPNPAAKAANYERKCVEPPASGTWKKVEPWGIGKPDCKEAPWQRDNHLGNSHGGFASTYNWTLPTDEPCLDGSCSCVLRIRYNISTPHTKNWPDNFVDSRSNGQKLSPIVNDPNVEVENQNLTLAIDTAQYGRGFQDRSHVFKLIKRPDGISKDTKIYNLNVRGKRGNIVQTFPATEYDFVPTQLKAKVGDYVHFQWTGCDTNPNNNAGEGTQGTDRSNIVQIKSYASQYPLTAAELEKDVQPMFEDASLRKKMAHLEQEGCLSYNDLLKKHNNQGDREQDPQNCMKLNAAPRRFDGGLIRMNKTGTFYYMSSRNNNFSNRSQKAQLVVEDPFPKWAIATITVVGFAVVSAAAVGGSVLYAKKHPGSKIGELVARVPGLNKI